MHAPGASWWWCLSSLEVLVSGALSPAFGERRAVTVNPYVSISWRPGTCMLIPSLRCCRMLFRVEADAAFHETTCVASSFPEEVMSN